MPPLKYLTTWRYFDNYMVYLLALGTHYIEKGDFEIMATKKKAKKVAKKKVAKKKK